MSKVDGMVEDGFETIRDAFAEAQLQDEGGAQLCIYRHGKRVVDLWTGRDKVNDRPYTADTISIVMSCGKGVTATCAHLLVERGLLDMDTPAAHYWPEFAANGKANIPVSYLLSHRAGLPSFPPDPLRFALGYELSRTGSPMLGTGSFGHAGAGGRLGFVHPESGIAVGYVCNNMLWDYTRGPDDRWLPWSKALREVAGL